LFKKMMQLLDFSGFFMYKSSAIMIDWRRRMTIRNFAELLGGSSRHALGIVVTVIFMMVGVGSANAAQSGPEVKDSKNASLNKRKTSKSVVLAKRQVYRSSVVSRSKPSFGQLAGLHHVSDALDLKSSVALVIDQDTNEVLFSKNEQAIVPIASITKLMTGLLISEANLPMDEIIEISQADVDTEKGSSSRLRVGAQLSRREMLHLALMSSENRAASALGRTFPGGLPNFVGLMNQKARQLGMQDTRYVEPTGLSSKNQSSAHDLALLVNVASHDPLLREYSTSHGYQVAVGKKVLQYNNTNRLVKNPIWDIGLQKTGYISEAGQCLVMQAKVAGRKLIMVFLDSAGKLSRLGDAERVRHWVETIPVKSPIVSFSNSERLALN
jgi:serine-type D-Ala-D-Ala endopeptidase (penicillin-binding protein 7)